MRPAMLLALVFFVVPLVRSQEKPALLAKIDLFGDFLTAEGVWRPDNLNDKTEIAFPSVIRLECYKHGGKDLVGSDAYCMQATAQIEFGNPEIDVTYYPVLRGTRIRSSQRTLLQSHFLSASGRRSQSIFTINR